MAHNTQLSKVTVRKLASGLEYSVIKRTHRCERGAKDILKFRQLRQAVGRLIDPATAEVKCKVVPIFDPYAIGRKLPDGIRSVRIEYFARHAGSKTLVWFGDLPQPTAEALLKKHGAKLALNTSALVAQAA